MCVILLDSQHHKKSCFVFLPNQKSSIVVLWYCYTDITYTLLERSNSAAFQGLLYVLVSLAQQKIIPRFSVFLRR